MIHLLLMLLFIGCAVALVFWGFTRLPIPEPIKTLLLVFVGLVALVLIWQATQGLSLG